MSMFLEHKIFGVQAYWKNQGLSFYKSNISYKVSWNWILCIVDDYEPQPHTKTNKLQSNVA